MAGLGDGGVPDVVVCGVMTLLAGSLHARSGAPTLEDAQSAADALVRAGVGEVWLYGSVARGEAHSGSDIDLVAVFDDLDYRRRSNTTARLQRTAAETCGQRVEVLVTDRAEWRVQRERVPASFASAISCNLILLACSPDPPGEVDWDKEQVMATSDDELALERLQATLTNLDKIPPALEPGRSERELTHSDDHLKYERVRGCRMIMVCEVAHLTVENAAKALAILGGVPARTLWTHNVAQLVGSLDDAISRDLRTLLSTAPELVEHEGYITMWRTRGAYGTPGEGMTAQQIATPAFATAMALIACDTADYTARTARHYLGPQDVIKELAEQSRNIRGYLTDYDIATGEPATT